MKVLKTNIGEIRDLVSSLFEYQAVDCLDRGVTDLDIEYGYYTHKESGLVAFNDNISCSGLWDKARLFTVDNIHHEYYHRLYQFKNKNVTTRLIEKQLLFGKEELFQNNMHGVNKYVDRYILEHGHGEDFVSIVADMSSEEEIFHAESEDGYRASGTTTRKISTSENINKTALGKKAHESLLIERKKVLDLCQNKVLISFKGYSLEEK